MIGKWIFLGPQECDSHTTSIYMCIYIYVSLYLYHRKSQWLPLGYLWCYLWLLKWVIWLSGDIHIYIYISIHILYTYTHIHIYTCTHIHIYTYTHIHIHTYTLIHIHTCVCMYIYIHTYTTGLHQMVLIHFLGPPSWTPSELPRRWRGRWPLGGAKAFRRRAAQSGASWGPFWIGKSGTHPKTLIFV